MSLLPIPAKIFFSDSPDDVFEYSVLRNNNCISVFSGLANTDENGNYIGFLVSDTPDIQIGDVLTSNNKHYTVSFIDYDCYRKVPELLKAYY